MDFGNKKPVCVVNGTDGNIFAIITLVVRTLKRYGKLKEAKHFMNQAMKSNSYDDVLNLCTEYVEVE